MSESIRHATPNDAPEGGFTFIEVLIATVILSIGVVGTLAIFPQAVRDTANAGHISVLNHLASERIELLRSLSYSDSNLTAGTHPTIATDPSGAKYYPVTGLDENYSLRWRVVAGPTNGAGTAEPNIKTVIVEATFLQRYTSGGVPIANDESLEVFMRTFVIDE